MKNKLVVFSPTPSHPQSAGNRSRIFALTKEIQERGFYIHFIYYTQEGLTPEQRTQMKECWNELTIIPKNKEYSLKGKTHYSADDWYQDGLGEEVAKICEREEPCAILLNYIFQSKILEYIDKSIVRIIDTIDIFTDRNIMLEKSGIEPDYFYTTKLEEKKCLERADYIIAIQENEAHFFRSLVGDKVLVVPHVVRNQTPLNNQESAKPKKGIILGFLGSDNSLNIKSINQFIKVFDRLNLKSGNMFKLRIAGSVCNKVATKNPDIELLGPVSSTSRFLTSLDLAISPLITGTGLKIKTIDALANNIPVLSTQSGFDGLHSNSPLHTLKTIEDFEWALEKIASDKMEFTRLKNSSRIAYKEYMDFLSKSIINLINTLDSKENLKQAKNDPAANRESNTDICFVTHINFWELNLGSKIRLHSLVKYLKTHFRVKIFYCGEKKDSDLKKLGSLGMTNTVVFYKDHENHDDSALSLANQCIDKKLFKPIEPLIEKKHIMAFIAWQKNNPFKVIIAEYIQFSWVTDIINKNVYSILDSIDVMWKRKESFDKTNQKHHISISEKQEHKLYKLFDRVIAIQRDEFNYIKSLSVETSYVPVALGSKSSTIGGEFKKLMFIGGKQSANIEGLNWFLNNVWCYLSGESLELHVYGEICDFICKDEHTNVIFHGRVKNIESAYKGADAAINPVFFGGGLKIKSVEAICHGLPLITSKQGASGIEPADQKFYMLANNIDEWLYAILALKKSIPLRQALGSNCQKYSHAHLVDEACYSNLLSVLKDAINCNE